PPQKVQPGRESSDTWGRAWPPSRYSALRRSRRPWRGCRGLETHEAADPAKQWSMPLKIRSPQPTMKWQLSVSGKSQQPADGGRASRYSAWTRYRCPLPWLRQQATRDLCDHDIWQYGRPG